MNHLEKYEFIKFADKYNDWIPFNEPDPGEPGYDPEKAIRDSAWGSGDDEVAAAKRDGTFRSLRKDHRKLYNQNQRQQWSRQQDQNYMRQNNYGQGWGGYGPGQGWGYNPGYFQGYPQQQRGGRFSHIKNKGDRKFLRNALRERRQARRDKRQNKNQTPAPVDPVTSPMGTTTQPPAAPQQPAAPQPNLTNVPQGTTINQTPSGPVSAAPGSTQQPGWDPNTPSAPQAPSAPPAAPQQPASSQPATPPNAGQPGGVAPSVMQSATQLPQTPDQVASSFKPQPLPAAPAIPGGMQNLQNSAQQAEASNVANTAQTNLMGNLQNDIKGIQQNNPLQGLGSAAENAGYDMNAPRADRMEGPLQGLSAAAQNAGYDMNAPRQAPQSPLAAPDSSQAQQQPVTDYGADSQSTTPSSMTTHWPIPEAQPAQKPTYDIGSQIANINQQGAKDMANWQAPKIDLPKIDLPKLPSAGLPGTNSGNFKPAPAVAQTTPPNTQPRG